MNIKSNVTAIIPCYNDGQYIMQALQSLYKQTLLPEKIIIVDDGSNEATRNVLKKIEHPSVQIVYQDNKGVSNARNKAISLAETAYILNLDSDDYFEPTFIEKTVEVLNKNKQVAIVSSYCRTFKGKNTEIEIVKPRGGKVKDFIVKNNGRANSLFRKQCWEQVGGYDDNMLNGYEDWEFWIAILKNNWSMYIIKEILSHYRIKTISRDQKALSVFDFELRKYIFNKHRDLFRTHFDVYAIELLRRNSVLKNNVFKLNKAVDFKIGKLILTPVRFFKQKFGL